LESVVQALKEFLDFLCGELMCVEWPVPISNKGAFTYGR